MSNEKTGASHITSLKELIAWQKARELTRKVYEVSRKRPVCAGLCVGQPDEACVDLDYVQHRRRL